MKQNNILEQDFEGDELCRGMKLLYGQYEIEQHLVDGGFGTTYLARDSLGRRVVVKECFPTAICRRINGEVRPCTAADQKKYQDVIRSFVHEAMRLAKLEHDKIVRVHQVFQENNTAYMAMDFVDGLDMLTVVEQEPRRLTAALLEKVLRDVLSALSYLHNLGMLHRDISPDNLILDIDDNVTLIDFGAAREDHHRKTRALSSLRSVKDGYSPHEFYISDATQEQCSDLYSLAATFYHLITGEAPPDSQARIGALASEEPDPYAPLAAKQHRGLPRHFLSAIDKAMSIRQSERLQSADEWLSWLDNNGTVSQSRIAEPARHAPHVRPRGTGVETPSRDVARDVAKEYLPPVELDPSLVDAISSLVEDTNRVLTSAAPKTDKPKETAEATANKDEEPHQLVDLFGEPIHDIEAWLREQNRAYEKQSRQDKSGADGADPHSNEPQVRTRSTLLRVLSSLAGRRRRTRATEQT